MKERLDDSVQNVDHDCACDVDLLRDDELVDDPCPRCGGRVWFPIRVPESQRRSEKDANMSLNQEAPGCLFSNDEEPVGVTDWEAYWAGLRQGIEDMLSLYDKLEQAGILMKSGRFYRELDGVLDPEYVITERWRRQLEARGVLAPKPEPDYTKPA